jgi:hypothetical protein
MLRDNFLSFYLKACSEKMPTVRSNLFSYGYDSQLRRMPADGEDPNCMQPRKDASQMPRHKIATDDAAFNCLFSLLDLHRVV